jgi:hypothetical protein
MDEDRLSETLIGNHANVGPYIQSWKNFVREIGALCETAGSFGGEPGCRRY